MNLKYLGDALDHWKGSIFEGLGRATVLRDFAADGMTSDGSAWQPDDWLLFARLLRIQPAQIVTHQSELVTDRRQYFQEIGHRSDLFLDPDTGIATGKVENPTQYLQPDELLARLGLEEKRIVAVYQHIRAKKTRDRLEEVIKSVRQLDSRFACCSYESGTVALLFFSRTSDRIREVAGYFQSVLGRHADGRINVWEAPRLASAKSV